MNKLAIDKSTFDAYRQFVQDFLAPELRGIKVTQETQAVAIVELRADMRELRTEMRAGFERLERRLETYDDVQSLKVEMAEIRGERRSRQAEPAA